MLVNLKEFISKNFLIVIFALYLIFIFGIFFLSGNIKAANFTDGYILGGDSNRYINGANKILNFELPREKDSSYLGYNLFISIFQYFELNLTYVTIAQIFLTILSAICIYRISKELSSDLGGLFSVSLYLFYFPLQKYNFYILTETIFICSIIFIIYFLIFFKKKYIPILIFLTLYYILIRPHGVLIIPSLILATLTWVYFNKKFKFFYLLIFLFILLSFPLYNFLNFHLENMNIINNIAVGGIIHGYEDKSNFLEFNTPVNTNNDLLSLIYFFKDNFGVFMGSIYKKLYFFIFRVRPYYSEIHNLYIILYNFIYLPLAIYGLFKSHFNRKFYIYFLYSVIVIFSLSVTISLVDWSGRFSLYIMPILFIFSGIGFHNLKKKIEIKF